LKTRSKSTSTEPLIDFLAHRERKLWLIDQKLTNFAPSKFTLGGISPQAITRRQIKLESCSNPVKTREGV